MLLRLRCRITRYTDKSHDAEMQEVQLILEREAGILMFMREDRMATSSTNRSASSFTQCMPFRRRNIRQLLAMWEAWHLFLQPEGHKVPDCLSTS